MKRSSVLALIGITIFLIPVIPAAYSFGIGGWGGFIGILNVATHTFPITALLAIAFLIAAVFLKIKESRISNV